MSLNRRPTWHHIVAVFSNSFVFFFRAQLMFLIPRRATFVRHFTVLAFESSADDTCAAIVTSSRKILSNVVIKQNHL